MNEIRPASAPDSAHVGVGVAADSVRIARSVRAAAPATPRVLELAAMFGLGLDEARRIVVVPPVSIPIRGGSVVFVTGPSGSGKSTVLRLLAEALSSRAGCDSASPGRTRVHRFEDLDPPRPDRALVDQIGATLEAGAGRLAEVGLADAFVMLRRPGELSDGQRHRFALARLMDLVERPGRATEAERHVVLADEFGATLDRPTAFTLARSVRRWVTRRRDVCFVAATTHDDLLEPLAPDVLVHKQLGEAVEVHVREEPDRGDA